MQREKPLLDIVRALHPASRFTGRLNRRQQKRDQNSNNRNDDEKFNKGKSSLIATPPILTFISLFMEQLSFQKNFND